MGQCGCGEYPIEQAYQLPDRTVIGVRIYHGCRNCHQGPAVDISVFPNKTSEWLSFAKIRNLEPDEYGGKTEGWKSIGIPIPLFEVRDMVAAFRAMADEGEVDEALDFADWLDEYGLLMIQRAMRLFSKRMEK